MLIFLFLNIVNSNSNDFRLINNYSLTNNCIIWTKYQRFRLTEIQEIQKIAYLTDQEQQIQFLIDILQYRHILQFEEIKIEYNFTSIIYEGRWILNYLGQNSEKNLFLFTSLAQNGVIEYKKISSKFINLYVAQFIDTPEIKLQIKILQNQYLLIKQQKQKILNDSQLLLEDSYSISFWYQYATISHAGILIKLYKADTLLEIVLNQNKELAINTYNIKKNNQIDLIDYKFTLEEELENKWIFFSLNHYKKQMILKILPYKPKIIFQNLNQYSYTNIISYIGDKVELITINSCLLQVEEKLECYGCLYCVGPYQNQCEMCDQRQYYHNIDKTCYCKFGLIKQGDQCLELNEILSYTEQSYDAILIKECPEGHFEDDNECVQCPIDFEQNQGKVNCGDCYLNPFEFRDKRSCTFDLKKFDDQSDFSISQRHENNFQFYLGQFFLDNAFSICDEQVKCFSLNFFTFGYRLMVQCKLNYVNVDDKCIRCTDNCRICSPYVGKCLECDDSYFLYQNLCYENQQNCLFINYGTQCEKCKKGYFLNQYSKCEECPIDCQYCQLHDIYGQSLLICQDNRQNNNYISISYQEIQNCDIYLNLMNELYQYLNLTEPVSICGKCQRGYINGFTECIQSQNQSMIIKYNQIEFELIRLQENIQIQFCNSYFYIQNNTQYCLECQDGYYQDRYHGYCLKCINCLRCVQFYDQLSPDIIQLYYQYFNLPVINLINQKHLYTECIQCTQDKELYNGQCIKKCPMYCKRCQIIDNANICVECIKDEHESFIIFNNQCYKCELGCEICVVKAKIDINIFNQYYQQEENSLTKCIKSKKITQLNIKKHLIFDINVFCDFLEYKENFDNQSVFIDDIFSKSNQSYFGKLDSIEIINFFNQIKLKTLLLNINIIPSQNGQCLITQQTFIPQIQKHIYTLQKIYVVLQSEKNCSLLISKNLQFYNISYLQIRGFDILINNNVITIFDINNVLIQNINFYQTSNDSQFMIYMSSPSIKFQNIILKYIQLSNIFIRIINEIIALDFSKIYIIDCNFTNFLFLQYYYTKSFIFEQSYINAHFKNSSLIQQNSYNKNKQNSSIFEVQFVIYSIDSFILNLNQNYSYTKLVRILVNNSVFINSQFLRAQNLDIYYFFCTLNNINNSQIINAYKQIDYSIQIEQSKWLFEILIFRSNLLNYQSQLIVIYNEMQHDELRFDTLFLELNIQVGTNIDKNSLVYINQMNTFINNATFRRTGGITEIIIIHSFSVQIHNLSVTQYARCQGNQCYNSVIKMIGINKILMRQCRFDDLTAIQTIIQLMGKQEQNIPQEQYSIHFIEIVFINIFLKSQNKYANLLTIQNLAKYQIIFDQIFMKNIVAIMIQNQDFGLIYVQSEYSNVSIKDSKCFNNFISNSSLFYLNAQNISIENSQFSFLNKNYAQIQKFIQNQKVYFEQFNQLINQNGGFFYINAQCIFTDAVATQGGAISINDFNILVIKDSDFSHLNTQYNNFDVNLGGAIYLESKYSVQIIIEQTYFIECFSLQGGAIYISLQNKAFILLDKVALIDNYAVIGSFLKTNLNHKNLNQISMKQSTIMYSFNNQLHNKISLDQYEIHNNENQVFNLDNCKILLTDLNSEGKIGLGLLFGQNISLYINNLFITNVNNFISSMIYVKNLQYAKIFKMQNFNIQPLSVLQECTQYYLILPKLDFIFSMVSGEIVLIQQFYNQSYQENMLQCNYNLLQETVKKFSFIFLQGYDNKININKVRIQSINFLQQQSQIIIIQGNSVKIKQLYMFQNKCGFNGCFYINQQFLSRRILKEENHEFNLYDSLIYENEANGGDIIFMETPKILFQNVVFSKNIIKNNVGSIIHIQQSQITLFIQLKLSDNIQSNAAQFKFEQSMIPSLIQTQVQCKQQRYMISQAAGYTISFRNQIFSKILIKQIQKIQSYSLLVKDYILPKGEITDNNTIYLPCGQKLKLYKYFNNDRKLINLNLTFNIQFLNILNELTQQENGIYCQIQIENQSTYYLNYTNLFQFDDFIVYDDPYKNQTIQGQITCLPFTQILYMNIRTYKCQIGEQFLSNSCIPCDDSQQFYNILPGQKCKLANSDFIKDVLNNQLILQQGYWRPNYNDKIEFCVNNPQNCQGGIEIGDKSCQMGYIGVLCELCDIYNVQGFGSHGYNGNFNCSQCDLNKQLINIIILILISIWIILIYKYLIESIQENMYWVNRLQILNKKGIKTQKQLKQTYLFQLLLQQIFAYNIYQMTNIYQYNWFNVIAILGNPYYTIERHLDCFHQYMHSQNEAQNRIIIKIFTPIIFTVVLTISLKSQLKVLVLKLFIYCQYLNILMLFINTLLTNQVSGLEFIGFAPIEYEAFSPYKYCIIYPIILIIFTTPILIHSKLKVIKNRQEWSFIFIDYKEQHQYWEFISLLQQIVTLLVFMSNISRNLIYFSGLAIYLIYRKVFQYYQPLKDILQRKITDTILYNQAIIIIILLILNQNNLVFIQYAVFWFYTQNLSLILHHLLNEQSELYNQKIIKSTINQYIPKFNRGKQSQIKFVSIIRKKVIQQQFRQNLSQNKNSSYMEFELTTLKTEVQ